MWRAAANGELLGIGCMRLSTERDRDAARAIAVLHAAFDAGINFLDTADAYCWDAAEAGHNERLIARALSTWNGDRSRVVVATKGGLTRPQGHWVADGRARHLAAACESSRDALGVDRIQLYQLHAPDPRTPLATSVRALDSLKRVGMVEAIGLCNVNVGQIKEARRITEIASVQVELNVWNDESLLNGVAEYCAANAILLVAHRPLGGAKRLRRTLADSALATTAARHRATPAEIALAWLRDLSTIVVPIAGPTRVESALSIARAHALALTDDDRAVLDERFPMGRRLRDASHGARDNPRDPRPVAPLEDLRDPRPVAPLEDPRDPRPVAPLEDPRDPRPVIRIQTRTDAEVVLIMGLPGAGKSTLAGTFLASGYERLNRDETGGSLSGLLPAVIASGSSRIVLDNTYVSRKSRAAVIEAARRRGVPVRCVWLTTSLEDSQVNAVQRIVSRHGHTLGPEEMRGKRKSDVAVFAPGIQFRYQRELEPPDRSEGFSRIDIVPFERTRDTAFDNRALIIWGDGVLWQSRSGRRTPSAPDDVEVVSGTREVLRRYEADGWRLLGLSWQPEIADESRTREQTDAAFARMQELLELPIEIEYCPHGAGPPTCWCRKPLPGLGVVFIQRHRLDPSKCLYVGVGPQDRGFARRLGFEYRDAAEFFVTGA